MKLHFIILLGFLVWHVSNVHAHQISPSEQDAFVDIPQYAPPVEGPTATTALTALNNLLATFNGAMKSVFMFALDAPERAQWSNLPARFVNRPGIRVGEMSKEQRTLFFAFLSASLSKSGYQRVSEIMTAEAFLSGDSRATFMKWNPENYWFSVYGNPSPDGQWGWQLGGHHLAINMSINEGTVQSMSPSFVGIEPAVFVYDKDKYNAMVDMHQAGFAMYNALDNNQKLQATLDGVPSDVVTGPGKDRLIPPQVGILAADMTKAQRTLLLHAINMWVSMQPNENARHRMQEIQTTLDETAFAWTGSDTVSSNSYFRIQGPSVIIELLSTESNVGQSAEGLGHYHTMYRNPGMEYGQRPRR